MMEFPIQELLDEDACYAFLLRHLHPEGLRCPTGHALANHQAPHMKDRAPVVDYRCRQCGRVFNAFTGTLWQQTHYACSTIVLILRGFAQGVPTAHLARELGIDRGTLLDYRHQLQAQLVAAFPPGATERSRGGGG